MNYYDEVISKIEKTIKNEEYDEASFLIKQELNVPYVPKEIENKLKNLLENIKEYLIKPSKEISDELIIDYLHSSNDKQIIAISSLIKKNLRNYLDLINEYLCSEGFINCKVVLVDELIRQEINEEIKMNANGMEYTFIPKYLLVPEESDAYIYALEILKDEYMKEPSKLELAKQLLYKDLLMSLPINLIDEEGKLLAKEIIKYIDAAFNGNANEVLN